MLTHQTRVYLHGGYAAAINGFANSIVVVMVDPMKFNMTDIAGIKSLVTVALASAAFSFFTYVKEHPLPDPEKDVDFPQAAQAVVSAVVRQNTGTGDGTKPAADLKLE